MKVLIVLGVLIVGTVGIVIALGSTTEPSAYDDFDAGVTGPLARGAVSVAMEPVNVWKYPKDTTSAKQRKDWLVAVLNNGEEFRVLNHWRPRQILWVQVQSSQRPAVIGWLKSPAEQPVMAKKVN